jgi:hypothetical protein
VKPLDKASYLGGLSLNLKSITMEQLSKNQREKEQKNQNNSLRIAFIPIELRMPKDAVIIAPTKLPELSWLCAAHTWIKRPFAVDYASPATISLENWDSIKIEKMRGKCQVLFNIIQYITNPKSFRCYDFIFLKYQSNTK